MVQVSIIRLRMRSLLPKMERFLVLAQNALLAVAPFPLIIFGAKEERTVWGLC